ncbi:ArsA family ATPase [Tsukamurella soli]|uniref:ArsA family ATPase n=1 Tax=Tsukamurella soli TaxID=644556 RepID=A0ABP8J8H2_9ACTN
MVSSEGADPGAGGRWTAELQQARLHFVSGKGGTGKSTVAAALALAIASSGKKVLLVEVEGRAGIAPSFEVPDLPTTEQKIATAASGGVVFALSMDVEATFLDYLKTNYGMGMAARALRRIGAIEFATTLAPGLKDILITGKLMECTQRREGDRYVYDAVVVDAPPTGRIGKFLDVTRAMRDIAKAGPISGQAERVVDLLHSPDTVVHLVTLLESLPVQESAEAAAELRELDLRLGAVVVNRALPRFLPDDLVPAFADARVDGPAVRTELAAAGLTVTDDAFAGLLAETIDYARTLRGQEEARRDLDRIAAGGPVLELPLLPDGVDLGGIYELADRLTKAGAR